jgi:polyisoprenyl-phosphate glycosyltransferase
LTEPDFLAHHENASSATCYRAEAFGSETAADLTGTPAELRLSIVIPCFNEEGGLSTLHRRVAAAARANVGDSYEIILVNDGSTDGTLARMRDLAATDPHLFCIDLSRNHGHQLALTAGLNLSRGQRILIIDADLQDPPELLTDMMKRMDEGADVVYGQRLERQGETRFKKLSALVFYRLLYRLSEVRIPVDTGDFRLMSRQILDVLNRMPERHRFVRGMVAWAGFRQVAIPYVREARFAGETKYPLRKMIAFAADALTGFSIRPLHLSFYLALGAMGIAALLALYTLIQWWLGATVVGWTSMMLVVVAFGSVQLLCLGILGEYLGRTYLETKRRPLFLIREIITQRGLSDAGCARAPACEAPGTTP